MDGTLFGEDQPCFGCSPKHPIGFRLAFEIDGETVLTRFTPGEVYQGPPGIMHGGLVSTLADELAAWALIALRNRFGFTTSFSCKFHQPVRILKEIEGKAVIRSDRQRIFQIRTELSQDDVLCYTGDFVFVVFDEKGMARMLQQPVPEDWKQFARSGLEDAPK